MNWTQKAFVNCLPGQSLWKRFKLCNNATLCVAIHATTGAIHAYTVCDSRNHRFQFTCYGRGNPSPTARVALWRIQQMLYKDKVLWIVGASLPETLGYRVAPRLPHLSFWMERRRNEECLSLASFSGIFRLHFVSLKMTKRQQLTLSCHSEWSAGAMKNLFTKRKVVRYDVAKWYALTGAICSANAIC